jgi:DNA polymerase-3 subunit gamma/tau
MAKRKAEPAVEPGPPPAEYTVVARRYRPQQFADLVGQEPVVRTLVNAIQSGRIAHAYLFTGVRGVGKTSAARILAKCLNCEKGPTPTPCDKCESCLAIAVGQDVDVVEIDGASNNRVDEIRELRQNVQFRPSHSRFKIYIIDEVHMVTTAAFNALLKTLEEPPPHVKFIFATTEVRKIPDTILSRVQRFDFAGIEGGRIVARLKKIVVGEKREGDDEALELVARRAGGSMRDAQSLLDQLLAFGEDRLTAEQVHRMLGTAPDDVIAGVAAAVLAKDTKQALARLDAGLTGSLQPGELLLQLIDYWRDLMLVATAGADVAGLSATGKLKEAIAGQAGTVPLDTILAGLDILQTSLLRLRGSTHGRVLLEMAVIRLSRLEDLVSLSQLAQMLRGGAGVASPTTARAASLPSLVQRAAEPDTSKKKPLSDNDAVTQESLRALWPELLAQIGPLHGGNLEKAGFPAIIGPNRLVVRFPAVYNRQCEFCSDPSRLNRVLDALERLTGRSWELRLEVAAETNGTPPNPVPAAPAQPATHHPLVQSAIDLLGSRLLKVEDGFGQALATEDSEGPTADDDEEQ